MTPQTLEAGDIVQLNPERFTGDHALWGGCLLIVTEPKAFGCQGYIPTPEGQVFLRPSWEKMELVGRAEWVRGTRE